jgi:alkylation response protein AidB-like acyl-CoA dehydrogenase
VAATTSVGDGSGAVAADDPVLRQRLARVYLEGEYLKLLADRAVSGALHGREAGAESSVAKLLWSELEQRVAAVAGDVLGPAANTGEWGRDRVYSRALTIAGGTTQVNKNVVAQRILGLPKGA